jgi:hypothetical protein
MERRRVAALVSWTDCRQAVRHRRARFGEQVRGSAVFLTASS